jgi:hypothetical protein
MLSASAPGHTAHTRAVSAICCTELVTQPAARRRGLRHSCTAKDGRSRRLWRPGPGPGLCLACLRRSVIIIRGSWRRRNLVWLLNRRRGSHMVVTAKQRPAALGSEGHGSGHHVKLPPRQPSRRLHGSESARPGCLSPASVHQPGSEMIGSESAWQS